MLSADLPIARHPLPLYVKVFVLSHWLMSSCHRHLTQFDVKQDVIVIPEKLQLKNTTQKADSLLWDFGDGSHSRQADPAHLYRKSGIYEVSLTTYRGRKKQTAIKEIEVKVPEECYILIETPLGSMVAKLYDDTPLHRDNFLKLAENGFFDGLLFHRVIQGFVIQGGDADSRNAPPDKVLGSGGLDYTIPAEISLKNLHTKGALAAARTPDQVNPDKRSNGSQFYIVVGNPQTEYNLTKSEDEKGIKYSATQRQRYLDIGGTPQLDMEYTVFGEIVDGLHVLDKIASTKTTTGDRPVENIWMKISPIH